MRKRVLSLSMVLMLCILTFAGCSSTNAPASSTAAGSTASSTTAPAAEAGNAQDLEEVTLHFIFFDSKKPATDKVWDAISEKFWDQLHAKFDVQFIAGTDYKDKMLVKQAAGESWDLNFEGEWLTYFQMINKDAYMNLDDLLPTYAPALYDAYQKSGAIEAARSKGHIVALPWTNVMNTRPLALWRGDLIDVDPSTIKTIDDFEGLLFQLKEKYPDKYPIEVAGADAFKLKHDIGTIGGDYVYDAAEYLKSGKVVVSHFSQTEAYRDMAAYGKKWQDAGLIWADILVDQRDHNDLINQGMLLTKWGTYEAARATRPWVDPSYYWDSSILYEEQHWANRTPLANLVAIPRTAQNPERTLMFLNILETSQEMYDMVHYGIEGETYVMDGDMVAFPEGMNSGSSNYQLWQGRWALFKPQFMRPDTEYAAGFWAEEKEFAESTPSNFVSPLDGFSFDSEAVLTEYARLQQIFFDGNKMIDVGLAGDSNAAVDKLISDLQGAGMDKVTEELQKQIDDYMSTK